MITVVMSALNEEKNIQKSFKRLINALILFKYKYQIILIDDGSTDHSWDIACRYEVIAKDIDNSYQALKII
jgi:glycosyltransferase involved in cell wall biosynthesis